MGEPEDEQGWIEKSREGAAAAFEALVLRYQHMLHDLTYRMTGSLADAEDLTQEAFLAAYRNLRNYRAEARFSSWLYRIAVNQCLNWNKRRQRIEELQRNWLEDREDAGGTDGRMAQRVQQALLKLNPKQRAAVVLTTYDGLSHAEAARALGCSETTISWRLFAARAKLKKFLAKEVEVAHDE